MFCFIANYFLIFYFFVSLFVVVMKGAMREIHVYSLLTTKLQMMLIVQAYVNYLEIPDNKHLLSKMSKRRFL